MYRYNKNSGFQKGGSPWNKGKKAPACGLGKRGKALSKEHKLKISIGSKASSKNKGQNHYRWGGNSISYTSFHNHIRKVFGLAHKCENPNCPGKSKNYEWSFIHGRKNQRDIKNYRQLCVSCHRLYDRLKIKL